MMRPSSLALLGMAALLVACGDDEATGAGGGGEGGAGGGPQTVAASQMASSSTGLGGDGSLGETTAPTRTTIVTPYGGEAFPPLEMEAYAVTGDRGPLAVTGVTVDAGTRTVTVHTDPQKLGVTYTLSITRPGDPFDGREATFLAADTSEFWATEFEGFSDYRVTARRVAVGEHAVLYVEEGLTAQDVELTKERFDSLIFPTQTELFRDPPDRDDNGRIVLLGLDGQDWYGGYFNPLNTFSEAQAKQFGGHSNELEIIYFNVAIMGGFDPTNVVPHEYLHLLYAEEHGALDSWNWHNEGMAECAVAAVWGENEQSAWFYTSDPQEDLRAGKSLVSWEYGNYSQYAQAYVFLSYVAGQLGGLPGYSELFHAPGDPRELEGLFEERLGLSFAEVQLHALAAAWLQEPSGRFGFEGLIELPGRPQLAPAPEVALRSFAGAFFEVSAASVAPLGAGVDVLHLGIEATGARDDSAPFEVPEGIVIALNGLMDPLGSALESSGVLEEPAPPAQESSRGAPRTGAMRDPSWLHAPPVAPGHRAMRRFREATRLAR